MSWDSDGVLATAADELSLSYFQGDSLRTIHTLPLKSPITCLGWSKISDGILAGGSRGSICFWKKSGLLSSDPSRSFIKEDKVLDSSTVTAMQFCPSKQNLLAVAASEVFIMNLDTGLVNSDPNKYVFKLSQNTEKRELSSVSWNPQVQHILASASKSGVVTVWDLRNNRTLFNVHDPSYFDKSQCSSLNWNPEIPTQFVVSYNDPKSPCLQIWDLRKHEYPVKEFRSYHHSGITSTEWCPHDSGIFASCDSSGLNVVWNFKYGESITSFQTLENPKSVKWVPNSYGVISFENEAGDIEIRNMYETGVNEKGSVVKTTSDSVTEQKQSSEHVPKWLPRKAGVAFGFGNKLVSFTQNSGVVCVNTVRMPDPQLEEKTNELHKLYFSKNWDQVCKHFSGKASEAEKLQWDIMQAKKSGDPLEILKALGIDKKSIISETEKYTGKKRVKEEKQTPAKRSEDSFSFVELSAVDAENFFNIAANTEEKIRSPEYQMPTVEHHNTLTETVSRNINWDEGPEKLIKQNLILKNLECAIDCALMCGRVGEALIIAHHGGEDLFKKTKNTILNNSKDSYLKSTFFSLLSGDIAEMIQSADPRRWRESLGIIIMHGEYQLRYLATELSEKLTQENMVKEAQVCLMVADDFEALYKKWIEEAKEAIGLKEKHRFAQIQYLFFKAATYSLLSTPSFESEELENIYLEYFQALLENDLYNEAVSMLMEMKPPRFNSELMVISDRILRAETGHAPRAPWVPIQVKPVKKPQKAQKPSLPARTQPNKAAFPSSPAPRAPFQSEPSAGAPPSQPFSQAGIPPPPSSVAPPPKTQSIPGPPKTAPKPFPEPQKTPSQPFPTSQDLPTQQPQKPPQQPPKQFLPPQQPPPQPPKQLPQQPFPTQQSFPPQQPPQQSFPPQQLPQKPPQQSFPPQQSPRQPFSHPEPKPQQVPSQVAKPAPPKPAPPKPAFKPERRGPRTATPQTPEVDISSVPQDLADIANTWKQATELPEIVKNPRIKKDVDTKIQDLFNKLSSRALSDDITKLVTEMTQAFKSNDSNTALNLHMQLTHLSWSENGTWLTAAKRLIQAKSKS